MREVAIRHGSDEATRRQGEAARRRGDEATRRRDETARRRDDDGDKNDAQANDDQNGIEQGAVGPHGVPTQIAGQERCVGLISSTLQASSFKHQCALCPKIKSVLFSKINHPRFCILNLNGSL